MKRLVKLILAVFFVLFSIQNYAQGLIIKGGFNLSDMSINDKTEEFNPDITSIPGFHFGLTTEIPLNNYLIFEPGLLLSSKGAEAEILEVMGYGMNYKLYLLYLDIPLNFKVVYPLDDNFKIFGSVGPYAGIGLYGLAQLTYRDGSYEETDEEEISWGSDPDEDDIRRFDTGISFGAGFEYKSVIIGAYYDLGLANIAANRENMTMKNRVWKFSIGYRF